MHYLRAFFSLYLGIIIKTTTTTNKYILHIKYMQHTIFTLIPVWMLFWESVNVYMPLWINKFDTSSRIQRHYEINESNFLLNMYLKRKNIWTKIYTFLRHLFLLFLTSSLPKSCWRKKSTVKGWIFLHVLSFTVAWILINRVWYKVKNKKTFFPFKKRFSLALFKE